MQICSQVKPPNFFMNRTKYTNCPRSRRCHIRRTNGQTVGRVICRAFKGIFNLKERDEAERVGGS